jgi:hypothetical protein
MKLMYYLFTYIFVLYLMTLPASQTIGASNDWMSMNNELEANPEGSGVGRRLSMALLSPSRQMP